MRFTVPHQSHPILGRSVSRRSMFSAAAGAAAVAALAGCGGQAAADSQPSASSTPSGATDSFPVTIKHAWGSTTITKAPTRIANTGWSGEDAVLALGVVPVGIPKANFGQVDKLGLLPWTQEALDKLGATGSKLPSIYDETDSINTEAIADTDPDLILGVSSGITKQQYETLSKIAPTIPWTSTIAWGATWREVMNVTAEAMGRTDTGKKVIADCESAISAAIGKYPVLKDRTAAFMYFDPKNLSTIGLYTTGDARPAYLTDLGFKVPASVASESKGVSSFYKEISAEHADLFDDVDLIVIYGDATLVQAMQADSLLSKIPAIKRGSVVAVPDSATLSAALSPSVLSIPSQVGDYAARLAKAAEKIG